MSQTGVPGLTVERQTTDEGHVVMLTVNGRSALNLVGRETMQQCTDGISRLVGDDGIRCAVLSGPTARAFIGGADLGELGSLDERSAELFIRSIHGFCVAIREFPVPVIARLQGYCLGAGLEIAASCDLRVGDLTVQCGMPEVKVGVPSVIEAALLPMLVGWGKTRELLYRGHIIDAAEARRIGLLEHLTPSDALDTTLHEIIADISAAGPGAIRLQKRLIRDWEEQRPAQAIEAGVDAFVCAYQTDEPRRYVEEFFARRKTQKKA